MEIFYPCDRAITDNLNPRIPLEDIKELNQQMNCNIEYSDEMDVYFEEYNVPEHISIVNEMSQLAWDMDNIWGN